MKALLGLVFILGGIVLGLYVGVWVCLVGGIVDIINQVKAPESVDAMVIACGIVKILFAAISGWLSFFVCGAIGLALLKSSD
ncbi:MAG: hypothetical protein Q8Q37_03180 [bacterium]|nr:hypothetical protein [bacterium]